MSEDKFTLVKLYRSSYQIHGGKRFGDFIYFFPFNETEIYIKCQEKLSKSDLLRRKVLPKIHNFKFQSKYVSTKCKSLNAKKSI